MNGFKILLITILLLGAVLYLTKPERAVLRESAAVKPKEGTQTTEPLVRGAPTADLIRTQTAPSTPETEEPQKGLDPKESAARWSAVSKLLICMEGGACEEELPNDTPSAQYFAVRDRILAEVKWFRAHSPGTPEQAKRSIEAAHSLLARLEDEMVQLSVLEWLLELPPNPETPLLVAKHVRNVVDVELVQVIAKLFVRDRHPGNESVINEYVFTTIDRGATLASIEMAKLLPRLLTQENRAQMQRLLNVLPKNTDREKFVRLALFGGN